MYKDCFKLMDINKDGQLDKNDLRGAFDNVGVLMSESELDGLLGEISGPCTYDYMVKTKDVIGLFVAVKEEPEVEEPAPVEEAPEAEPEEDADAKKKKKKKKKAAK